MMWHLPFLTLRTLCAVVRSNGARRVADSEHMPSNHGNGSRANPEDAGAGATADASLGLLRDMLRTE